MKHLGVLKKAVLLVGAMFREVKVFFVRYVRNDNPHQKLVVVACWLTSATLSRDGPPVVIAVKIIQALWIGLAKIVNGTSKMNQLVALTKVTPLASVVKTNVLPSGHAVIAKENEPQPTQHPNVSSSFQPSGF